MINLYYRGYVIHEDIPSVCYTIFGRRPHRTEVGSSVTPKDAMGWVDRNLVQRRPPSGAAPRAGTGPTQLPPSCRAVKDLDV